MSRVVHGGLRLRNAVRVLAVTAVCVAAGTAFAPGALADGFSDGQWYVAPFKLADNHTIADGSGVTVAVIDGRFSRTAPSVAGADVVPPTNRECYDSKGDNSPTGTGPDTNHATAMTAMIVGQGGANVPLGVAPGAKVLQYTLGFTAPDGSGSFQCLTKTGQVAGNTDSQAASAIQDAVAKGARIVNLSFAGASAQAATRTAIMYGEQKGVVFVGGTQDQATQGSRLQPPAAFNGVVAVNAIDRNAKLASFAATGAQDGPLVVASAPGIGLSLGGYSAAGQWDPSMLVDGSSPATAFVSGVLAATLSKWPKATGNQLIQSLARNTGGTEHGLDARAQDGYGFGVPSLTSMLAHDPTRYPNENPLLRNGALPSTSDILGGASSSPTAPSSTSSSGSSGPSSGSSSSAPPTTGAPRAAADDGTSTGLVVGIVVGVVVVVALVVLVLVLVLRRGRRRGPPPPAPGPPPPVASGYR